MFIIAPNDSIAFRLSCPDSGRHALDYVIASVGEDLQAVIGCHVSESGEKVIHVEIDGSEGWENYSWQVSKDYKVLKISASDIFGAIRGLYALSGLLNINPFARFLDLPYRKIESLCIENREPSTPKFKFRGWFFNDEDYITGWRPIAGKRAVDYLFYSNVMSHITTEEIIESALRNSINLLIPSSFLDIDCDADEKKVHLITQRGLYVSQHHIEPLGVSHYAFANYWRLRGKQAVASYNSNPETFDEVWRHYVKKWAKYKRIVWQIGLRGNVDCPVWQSDSTVERTEEAAGRLISQALEHQARIIREETGEQTPLMTMTLWDEGAKLYTHGHLKTPKGTIIVFANIPGDQRMNMDFYEVPRETGAEYGIYHHNGYYARGPHLVQGHSANRIARLLQEVEENGDTAYAISNVQNLRELVFGAAFFSELTCRGSAHMNEALRAWHMSISPNKVKEIEELYSMFFQTYDIEKAFASDLNIWLDGDLRELALRCIDKYPKGTWHAYTAIHKGRPHDLNLIELQTQIDRNAYPETLQLLWSKWRATACDIENKLNQTFQNEPCRTFLIDNLYAQSRIMEGLSLWALKIILGVKSDEEGDHNTARECICKAITAMDAVIAARSMTENGKFRTWYSLDDKFDLLEMKRRTVEFHKWISENPAFRIAHSEDLPDHFDFINHYRYKFKREMPKSATLLTKPSTSRATTLKEILKSGGQERM